MRVEDFTLVIPTYNRPKMLAGALEYYVRSGVEFPIVVVDSSTDEAQEENAAAIARLGPGVSHIRYPTTISSFDKWFDLPDFIATPLGMYAPDDDIALLDGVLSCAQFLRTNPGFVGCHGIYYNAARSGNELKVGLEYGTVSLDFDGPIERIFALCRRYQAITYCVQRRETFAAARPPAQVYSSHFWELYNAFRILVEGKVAALATPYMIRNSDLGPSPTFMGDPNNWLACESPLMFEGYARFRDSLVTSIAPHTRGRSAGQCLDVAYALYLQRSLSPQAMVARLERDGDLAPGSATLLDAYAAMPNVAPAPAQSVSTVLRAFMSRGWPAFQ